MHEILRNLEPGAKVLDLGSGAWGSVSASAYPHLRLIRLDNEFPESAGDGLFVQGDAAKLAFGDGTFDTVIANHSLEHVTNLPMALAEIGRILKATGTLYVAVPDASTFTDRVYRWIFKGGGHVNAFYSAAELESLIAAATGLEPVTRRVLHSSFIFLCKHKLDGRPSRKLWLFGGGAPWFVTSLTYILRQCDRIFGTRLSVYGWAFYFGEIREQIDVAAWTNVCVTCGSGQSSRSLIANGEVRWILRALGYYRCAACGQWNLYTEDRLKSNDVVYWRLCVQRLQAYWAVPGRHLCSFRSKSWSCVRPTLTWDFRRDNWISATIT